MIECIRVPLSRARRDLYFFGNTGFAYLDLHAENYESLYSATRKFRHNGHLEAQGRGRRENWKNRPRDPLLDQSTEVLEAHTYMESYSKINEVRNISFVDAWFKKQQEGKSIEWKRELHLAIEHPAQKASIMFDDLCAFTHQNMGGNYDGMGGNHSGMGGNVTNYDPGTHHFDGNSLSNLNSSDKKRKWWTYSWILVFKRWMYQKSNMYCWNQDLERSRWCHADGPLAHSLVIA